MKKKICICNWVKLFSVVVILISGGCAWFNVEKDKDVVTMSPLPKVNNQLQITQIWSRSVGSGSGDFYTNLHPACQDEYVFAADRFGIVKAFDVNSGKEIWSTDLSIRTGSSFSSHKPAQLSGGITAVGDRIYIGSELAKVYALKITDGSIVWETTVVGEALSSPVVSNSVVLIHTSNGMLQALNEADGTRKWIINLENMLPMTIRGESTPTTVFGAAIVGGNNGMVSAIMLNQGQLIWQQRISSSQTTSGCNAIARIHDVQTTPVVVNNIVYAIAYNGNLAALDLRSGQVIWSQSIGSVNNLLVVDDSQRIYLVDQNDMIIAVNMQDGVKVWSQNGLLYRNLTSPVLYNSYIVTGDFEGYLHWINTDNGLFFAQQKVDCSGIMAIPIIASNKLIVQAKNGNIYSFKLL